MVETVTELIPLGGQIAAVLVVRSGLEGYLVDDREPEAFDAGELLRVVREEPDRAEAEVREDLVADPVFAGVGGEAERDVGLHGVESAGLEVIGPKLVQEADSAPLLGHVQEDAALLTGDLDESLVELLAAVAEERVKDVARQALGVDTDEDVLGAVHVALDEGEVLLVGEDLAERDRGELAVGGRKPDCRAALDELLVAAAVLDEVGDRDHAQAVTLAVGREVEIGRASCRER